MEIEVQVSNCACTEESDVGTHWVKDGVVYSEYYCFKCYNKKGNS